MAKENGANKLNNVNDIYFFLEDEVRNGFYIPAVMKQCFAAEIQVMEDLRAVCDRHGISFFADWGSLLGAARHGGFIPWDDDLDLVMLREDYMALLDLYENHPEEFPEGFEVRSFRNRENYTEFHGVVVGSKTISFAPEHLDKFYGFPYIAAVDIFVLDHKSTDPERQAQMARDALFTIAVADEIGEGKLTDKASIMSNLDKIRKSEFAGKVEVDLSKSPGKIRAALYDVAEKMFASFANEGSDSLIQNIPWGLLHPQSAIPLAYYRERVNLPFEYTNIPVPAAYDTMLTRKYRDYLKIVKNVAGHDYPCFKGQEENLLKDADFKLPAFEYDENVLKDINDKRIENRENSWKATFSQCLYLIEENLKKTGLELDAEDKLQLLADTQQLSIDMGSFVENITDRCTNFIASVERMCEVIFNLYNQISAGLEYHELYEELLNSFRPVKAEASSLLLLKEVVIFTFKPEGFYRLKGLWEEYQADENTRVKVIPIPYFHKKYDGSIVDSLYDTEGYPEGVELYSYEDHDLMLHHPDVIVTQFPYDGWNKVMGVDPVFYASNLASNTECLIYVPWFETDDFTKEAFCEYENTRHYVTMPGVVYSDEVILSSPVIRQTYIDRLCEFTGEDTRKLWEEKILVKEDLTDDTKISAGGLTGDGDKDKGERAKLLYYIGMASFVQDEEKIIDKIKNNLSIMSRVQDISIDILLDSTVEADLPDMRPELWKELCEAVSEYKDKLNILDFVPSVQAAVEYYSAYYGERSRYVTTFVRAHKPVMIQNCNV